MKNKKAVSKVFAAVTTVFFLYQSVSAAPEPIDPSRPTGLTVCLQSSGEDKKYEVGAEITIYKVADIKEDSGEIRYEYAGVFEGQTEDLSKEVPASAILGLAELAEGSGEGISATTDQNGTARFDELEQAVYLVTQTVTIQGFSSFEPFLSYLPDNDDGVWLYDVKAAPKIDYSDDPEHTPTPVPTVTPTPTGTPSKLPQTGQLKWPVPVLIVGGLIFVCAGLIIKFVRKQPDDET